MALRYGPVPVTIDSPACTRSRTRLRTRPGMALRRLPSRISAAFTLKPWVTKGPVSAAVMESSAVLEACSREALRCTAEVPAWAVGAPPSLDATPQQVIDSASDGYCT